MEWNWRSAQSNLNPDRVSNVKRGNQLFAASLSKSKKRRKQLLSGMTSLPSTLQLDVE